MMVLCDTALDSHNRVPPPATRVAVAHHEVYEDDEDAGRRQLHGQV